MYNEQLALVIAGNPNLLYKVSNAEIFINLQLFGKISEIQKILNDMAFGC